MGFFVMLSFSIQQKRGHKLFLVSLFLLVVARLGLSWLEYSFVDEVAAVTHYPSSSQVFDRKGRLLYEYVGEVRRIPASTEAIPEYMRQATLLAEDERFFSHAGFDPIGIVRALWSNMLSEDGQRQGASTLGQQLAKNTVLGRSKGYLDKVREVMLSVAIDASFSKDDILHLYLNTIPYGSNVYGVEAASRLYFRKSVSELTVAEAAVLAALPKHPTYLSPYGEHTDELRERRDYILGKMLERSVIDQDAYDEASRSEMVFAKNEMPIRAPHFVMDVRSQLEGLLGRETLEREGLAIYTTLDLDVQDMAERAVTDKQDSLRYNHADNASVVVLDPKTGDVLAMVGNRDYFDVEHAGNFNMATARRQPGSSFKPIAYATLLDTKSVTPATVLYDTQENFGTPKEPYIPRNYDGRFRGPVTLRDALAQSLNVPAVRALLIAGIDTVIDQAEDMGISTLEQRNRFGPSLVLGGAEVKLVELAGAYGAFANGGSYVQPQYVLEVRSGQSVLWKPDPYRGKLVLHPETAYQISSILSDPYARAPIFGLGGSLAFKDRPVAVKTGTTQAYRDAWTVGYTPSVVVGVWVGNEDNTPLRPGGSGAMAAAPIWRATMDAYLEGRPVEEFTATDRLQLVYIPTVVGVRKEYVAPWQYIAPKRVPFKTASIDIRP